MTAEFLLRALGLLDDDLIQEDGLPMAPKVTLLRQVRRWGSLCACLVLLLTAG